MSDNLCLQKEVVASFDFSEFYDRLGFGTMVRSRREAKRIKRRRQRFLWCGSGVWIM